VHQMMADDRAEWSPGGRRGQDRRQPSSLWSAVSV
jgi:hypothetical protein